MIDNSRKIEIISNLVNELSKDSNEALLKEIESVLNKNGKTLGFNEEPFIVKEKEYRIPLCVFSSSIGILEAAVKYLKENLELSYHDIAVLLNRDDRTVWVAYNKAVKKHPEIFSSKEENSVPIPIFSNRNLGPLEALVVYLKEQFSFVEISQMLNRNYGTIWTSYKNALKKK